MFDFCDRTIRLIGGEAAERLEAASVAVVGLGGVGGAAAEALARAGVGRLIIVDFDTVDITNINRQAFALHSNIGLQKTAAAQSRLLDINPSLQLELFNERFSPENSDFLFNSKPDFVADCIDTVTSKLWLISECQRLGVKIISSMGTGNRLLPERFATGMLSDTAGCGCGLARVMRKECRARGLLDIPVLYSLEEPKKPADGESRTPASISFCPPVAGYILAAYIINSICGQGGNKNEDKQK